MLLSISSISPSIFLSSSIKTTCKFKISPKFLASVNKETIDDNATALRYVYEENDQTSSQYINESLYNRTITVNVPDVALSFIKPYKNVTFQCGTMFSSLGLDSGATYRILRWTAEIVREGSGTETSYLHSVSFNLQQIDH